LTLSSAILTSKKSKGAMEATGRIGSFESNRSSSRPGSDTGRIRVLVVDDDDDIRRLLRVMLGDSERMMVVGEASTAAEALLLAKGGQAEVIVLDHGLGESTTGMEAAPALKAAAPEAKILLFTAFDLAGAARASTAIDGFVRKDHLDQLLGMIRRVAGRAG
jgi:DNA-binding NarL/FixJ family response regulator